ncbi:PREDICTED: uncharacterized protein LOC109330097 isoform X2 [Lupinus angustifolius]|uniref:uncharacterized protein LOC109330097 isoform X2 n=1 Tax=Lupinus angustifolius TaxID=3871 RepID=UPI00092E27A6|nr:PREDICTED: uncharacterized protein LOC109330097 isoform X2 [Lupinus angustifolius]
MGHHSSTTTNHSPPTRYLSPRSKRLKRTQSDKERGRERESERSNVSERGRGSDREDRNGRIHASAAVNAKPLDEVTNSRRAEHTGLMGTEIDVIEARVTSMLILLQSECGVLQRLVYKNKNQHRRCSYFQRLLKVRRDLKLLQSANIEELVTSCFLVLKGDRPKQKVHLLESLKRRKCDNGKHNFMERLLGVARLLAEMVEPILKAATEMSVLFARTFFMPFSVILMALLARLRVLVQQILLDVITLFNMVASLSKKKQSIKVTHEGVEVFREFYPVSEDFVMLECDWKVDKFILLERKNKRGNESQGEDSGGNVFVQASPIKYTCMESFIGDSQLVPEKVEADAAAKEDTSHVKDINTDLLTSLMQIDKGKDTECSEEGGESQGNTKAFFMESSLSQSSTTGKSHSRLKKVAFVSIENPKSTPQSSKSTSPLTADATNGK